MTRKKDGSDLCQNCSTRDHCGYLRHQKKSVTFCEEFSCETPVEVPAAPAMLEGAQASRIKHGKTNLCINCLESGTCSWQKNAEPKLHCEEYH